MPKSESYQISKPPPFVLVLGLSDRVYWPRAADKWGESLEPLATSLFACR